MEATYAVWAARANTRGSRGNDPDLERYLRTEFLGGTTVRALLGGSRGRAAGNGWAKVGVHGRLVKLLQPLRRILAVSARRAA